MVIKNDYKVVFITCNGGEYNVAEFFKYAAEKRGWQVKVYPFMGKEEEILAFDPDFIIQSTCTKPHMNDKLMAHRARRYLTLSVAHIMEAYNAKDDILNPSEDLKNYMSQMHGMLIAADKEIGIYKQIWEKKMDKIFNAIPFLPTAPKTTYEPAEPKKLVWSGMGWDNFRTSEKYKEFITALSYNIPMRVYGFYNNAIFLKPGTYGGFAPPGLETIGLLRRNGIYLISHSTGHFNTGIPSLRPFEAAAANVITISDRHPFIIEHFGDSMLYFDRDASAEEMYQQIKKHFDWIIANPEKAKEKANQAHQIFLKKFTIDQYLDHIAKMHEYVLQQEKQMDLDYHLSYKTYR